MIRIRLKSTQQKRIEQTQKSVRLNLTKGERCCQIISVNLEKDKVLDLFVALVSIKNES